MKSIGTNGNVDTVNVGGRTYTDMSDLIVLGAPTTGTGAYCTLRLSSSGSGYQVPSGHTLYLSSLSFVSASGAQFISIGYGDNDVGFASGSVPTSGTFMYQALFQFLTTNSSSGYSKAEYSFLFPVPQLKYPFIQQNLEVGTVQVYGYLDKQ